MKFLSLIFIFTYYSFCQEKLTIINISDSLQSFYCFEDTFTINIDSLLQLSKNSNIELKKNNDYLITYYYDKKGLLVKRFRIEIKLNRTSIILYGRLQRKFNHLSLTIEGRLNYCKGHGCPVTNYERNNSLIIFVNKYKVTKLKLLFN